MNKDMLDLIFVNRLIESPPEQYPQPPFQYLLGCFARAVNELRSVSPRHPPEVQQHLQGTIAACKELLVSYAALILTASGVVPEVGMRSCALMSVGFGLLAHCASSNMQLCNTCSIANCLLMQQQLKPAKLTHSVWDAGSMLKNCRAALLCCLLPLQPDAAAQRGALQLFDSMQAQFSSQGGLGGAAASPAVVALPLGFLEELAAAQDAEALGTIMGPMGKWRQLALDCVVAAGCSRFVAL
jgi:hypothetical protein